MTRAEQLKLIYRHTHKDYKGRTNGVRSVLTARGLVALDNLTDAEIADRLPAAQRREAERNGNR